MKKNRGLLIAVMVIIAWATWLVYNLTRELKWPEEFFWILPVILIQTFLYTGLFITAHDAMHGIIVPGNKLINRLFGRVAMLVYAFLSFDKMLKAHMEHHAEPGTGGDPDFSRPPGAPFWKWYLQFLGTYVSIWPVLGMAIAYNILAHVAGLAEYQLILYWLVPAVLSTIQLFYFGTYLPHRPLPDSPFADEHNARTNDYPVWLSFITCYHFGYHHEHHLFPFVPWWRLPEVRGKKTVNVRDFVYE